MKKPFCTLCGHEAEPGCWRVGCSHNNFKDESNLRSRILRTFNRVTGFVLRLVNMEKRPETARKCGGCTRQCTNFVTG